MVVFNMPKRVEEINCSAQRCKIQANSLKCTVALITLSLGIWKICFKQWSKAETEQIKHSQVLFTESHGVK